MRTIALFIASAIAGVPVMAQTTGPGQDKTQKTKAQKNAKNSAPGKNKVEKSQPGDDRPAQAAGK